MDKTVPSGAAILLAFIYETETSRKPPECYEVIYGHKQGKLAKPLTRMNLAEVQAAQRSWSKNHGSSAAGAPQLMRATLADLMTELKLSDKALLDGDMQDRLAYHLLKRRGYLDFMSGKISRTEFGKRLAQEWASFPVLAATAGGVKDKSGKPRTVQRGQSFYAGDGLNKSLVKPETVEAVLDEVKAATGAPVERVPAPAAPKTPATPGPAPKPERDLTTVGLTLAGLGALVATFWNWLVSLPCEYLNLFCGG